MSDSEHLKELAPLPWSSHKIPGTRAYRYRLVDAEDLTVLLIPGKAGTGTGDRAKEIAEYVLHVCNSHEELLEAAREALEKWFSSPAGRDPLLHRQLTEAIARGERGG